MGEKAFSNEIHEMICTECGKDLVDYIKHNKLKNFIRELKQQKNSESCMFDIHGEMDGHNR